jgi:hypothetical protein
MIMSQLMKILLMSQVFQERKSWEQIRERRQFIVQKLAALIGLVLPARNGIQELLLT